jgi:two-component system cell cycle sensor histidine kinase/response regulator CckA
MLDEPEKHKEILQKVFDNIPIMLSISDQTGRILLANKFWEQTTGWTVAEIQEQNINIFQQCFPNKNDYERIFNFIGESKGEWVECQIQARGGTLIDINVASVRLSDGTIIGIAQDITEKKKIEGQFLRTQRLESIGSLAGGIAHDLNNTLLPITIGLDLLRENPHSEKENNIFKIIETSAERATNMVKNILTFSRGAKVGMTIIQPDSVLQEIEQLIIKTFPKRIQIKTNIPNNLWAVSCDPTQLHQALLNLCINSRDAMPNGGLLDIRAENLVIDLDTGYSQLNIKSDEYVCINISDTGSGISQEIMERIFDPFFTTKEIGKGTGLGLSTTASLIKSHGGSIKVESELGKGSRFKIYLPAVPTLELLKKESKQTKIPGGHGEIILIIDDELSIREITRQTLEMYGYKVLAAADGVEGTAIFAQDKEIISLALIDMVMPFMDGFQTLQVLRRINPKVKVIIISGSAEPENSNEYADLRNEIFIQKPYTAEQLLIEVANMLKK